jgi:type IV secretory pathway VirB10-like protein
MTSAPDQSPNFLSGAPSRGFGVKRLNRLPVVFVLGLLLVIMGVILYTYELRREAVEAQRAARQEPPEPVSAIGVLKNAPSDGLIPARSEPQPAPPPPAVEKPVEPPAPDPNQEAWERYRQHLERLQQDRQQAAAQALGAPTQLSGSSGAVRPEPSAPAASPSSEPFTAAARLAAVRQSQFGGEERDLNHAEEKRQFLAERSPRSLQDNYLASTREAPLSPYEVKAGTIIPAVMVGGVNSDLPGQIIGQVSENVYDTATGRFILIPQGARLIGFYDNGVTDGQERVLVAWTRILYPDASSIDLGRMPGADEAGYAGFHDRVNDHFWKVFRNAMMLSLFSGGLQLSQGNGGASNGMTAQQTLTAALGQQMGQLGMEMARRNIQIQPTLEIRPGYRFVVQVTKDMPLGKPWTNKTAP